LSKAQFTYINESFGGRYNAASGTLWTDTNYSYDLYAKNIILISSLHRTVDKSYEGLKQSLIHNRFSGNPAMPASFLIWQRSLLQEINQAL
jgi:hypothetical protein